MLSEADCAQLNLLQLNYTQEIQDYQANLTPRTRVFPKPLIR